MKRIAFPCLCLLLLAVTSCQRDTAALRSALARAEAVMEENPQEARLILDSLSHEIVNHPNRQSDLALWALLRTQADYKCDIPLRSDSLARIATCYYGTKRKTQRAALAQHYLGCAYSDMGRDMDAIDAFLRASTLFPDTTNKYFANNLFELGILYTNHHMLDSAWVAFSRYRQTAVCNSDSVNIGYTDYHMGYVALRQGADDVADSLFRCVEQNTTCSNYIHYSSYFHLAKLYYYHKHDIEGAITYLDKLGNYFGQENGAVLSLKADILTEQQQPTLAYELSIKAINNSTDIYTQCSSYQRLVSITSLLNMPDSTRFYFNQYKALQDTIYVLSKQKEIAEVKDKHIVEIHDQQMRARNLRMQFGVGIFTIVLLSVFIITLLLIDRKRKNEKLQFEQKLRDIKQRHIDQNIKEEEPETEEENPNDSESEIDEPDTPITPSPSPHLSIQQERVTLYRTQFADSRWNRYLEERKVDVLSKKYMPKEDACSFRDYLQDLFADVFLDMVNENANVTRPDLEYCAMKLLGFSTAYIAYCAQVSFHSLHNRRYHIKDKLTPDWYTFIFGTP